MHRDIKPDNILIQSVENKSQYEVKLADLGLSAITPHGELLNFKCGSPGYIAPEVFKGSGYSYKADIFSLGAVFFKLITSRPLFSGNSPEEKLFLNS